MVSNVNFRAELRRTLSGKSADQQRSARPSIDTVMAPTEITPLVSRDVEAQENNHDDRSLVRRILLDTKSTPGVDSPNPLVKIPARIFNVTKVTLLDSWLNLLLVFVPVGIAAGALEWNPSVVFTLNFFAIIPLAGVLSFATEQISMKLGETLGGLLNATFGNAVELIVSVVALRAGEIEVVQSSMLGSILSNLLLVMGMCFILGGVWNMRDAQGLGTEQVFASATAQTTGSLMTLASSSLILPAVLYGVLSQAEESEKDASILLLSRGTAIILLFLYVLYLYFQLRTHKNLFASEAEESEQEESKLGVVSAASVLLVVTLIIAVCAEYLVDSIDAIVQSAHISKNFIGLILIPIVGNAAEHVTACVMAVRNKMDLAMGVAIGSSIQIAMLVTPALVILGWIIGQPMSLRFETFETVAFALSVLVVNYTVQDGKSNYLEGAMLMGLYLIIGLAFFVSPSDALDKVLTTITSF